MRPILVMPAVIIIAMSLAIPCNAQELIPFHSYAVLSDTDKISLVLQHLNNAIEQKSVDAVVECLPVPLRADSMVVNAVKDEFAAIFQRLDTLARVCASAKADKISLDVPTFHLTDITPAIVRSDTAEVVQPVYLGTNPTSFCDTVRLCLSSWLGMYGVTNISDLADNMNTILDATRPDTLKLLYANVKTISDKSMRVSSEVPNLLKHRPFHPGHHVQADVFNKGYANAEFDGKDLFGRPYDVQEMVIKTLGIEHWGMIASDANWDRFLYFGKKQEDEIIAGGEHYDLTNNRFRFAAGVSLLTDQDFYVCDAYHNRVARYMTNLENPYLDSSLTFIYNNFNFPVDVDAAHMPHYLGSWNSCWFDNWVAVCDQGNNRIVLTGFEGGYDTTVGSFGNGLFQLNKPTSVAFARDDQTGWPLHDIYVADAGNRRVVKFCLTDFSPIQYGQFWASHDSVFAPNAYLSSVDVDAFGQVYVLDSYNGMVYKFNNKLQLQSKWGGFGTDWDHLYYPVRMSVTRGWQDGIDSVCLGETIFIPRRVGDVLFTELYSATTGIKRFVLSNDLLDFQSGYQMRICNYADDYFYAEWDQADYGYVRTQISGPGINACTRQFYGPGHNEKKWMVPYNACTQGILTLSFDLYSAYDQTTPVALRGQTIQFHRDTCNYPPVFSYYPNLVNNEDSCVVRGRIYKCVVGVYDRDNVRNDLKYSWTTPVGIFAKMSDPDNFLYDSLPNLPGGDTVMLKIWYNAKDAMDRLREIFTVRVIDLGGGEIWGSCEKMIVNSIDECEWHSWEPACPVLYWNDGSEWRFINNLLAESEIVGAAAGPVSEIYPALDIGPSKTGQIQLRIAEEADEVTSLQSIRAVSVTYPESLKLISTGDARLFALTDNYINPTFAYTAAGDTVTDAIAHEDGKYFSDVGPGSLYVQYLFDTLQTGYAKPTTWGPGGPDLPPPSKAFDKPRVPMVVTPSGLYEFFARNESGGWTLAAKSFPRVAKTAQYFEMSDFITDDGMLTLRIDYRDSIGIDHLPYRFYRPVDVASRPLPLATAIHSTAGNVAAQIATDQGPEVVIKQGEGVDLVFQSSPPPTGYKQMILLASQGRYQRAEEYKPPPRTATFDQNYPNPFNPNTSFRYFLPEPRKVLLEIFNVLGQKVAVLADGLQAAGEHVVMWNSRDDKGNPVASGIYFARFAAGDYTATKKLEVLK